MKLYSENEKYSLYEGNMLDMLDIIEPNSIDSIITDPPYELNFMNRGWDNSGIAFKKETWEKCLQVLKPGGYMLVFGGSRTFHRIACAIEDAGFELRDTIMWIYGCLSEDTEILTSNGWKKHSEISINDTIYSLDLQNNILIKNKCLNVFKYDYDGEMINLKNQNTDQLLTPNHHVIVKDTIRTRTKEQTNYTKHDYWQYKDAWQIRSGTTTLPLASTYDGSIKLPNLLCELLGLIISDGYYHKECKSISIYQSEVNSSIISRIRYILGKLHIDYSEYVTERSYDKQAEYGTISLSDAKRGQTYKNHQFYIKSQHIVDIIREICPNKKLHWGLLELSYNNKEFLLKGLCMGDGGKARKGSFGYESYYQYDIEQLEIFQVLLHMTNKQGWINRKKYCCSISSNPNTQIQSKHNKNRIVPYEGKIVWCIETEIGNFIARRKGKIFITGNSGMTKGINLGLAIDKKNGVESKIIGKKEQTYPDYRDAGKQVTEKFGIDKLTFGQAENIKRKEVYAYEAQNEWNGWNSSLKPAFEPILVCRKPFKGTLVDNVMKYGVGGINIDECRIPFQSEEDKKETTQKNQHEQFNSKPYDNSVFGDASMVHRKDYNTDGRFPANLILSYDETDAEEVISGFPHTKSTGGSGEKSIINNFANIYGDYSHNKPGAHLGGLGDEGSAARYFYCAKASKKDRNDGLNEKNPHVTVKPCSLMQYLVRLVTPKNGTVLDPFNGSGSTGKACMYENNERDANYRYIGIEITSEYLPVSEARINFAINANEKEEI